MEKNIFEKNKYKKLIYKKKYITYKKDHNSKKYI